MHRHETASNLRSREHHAGIRRMGLFGENFCVSGILRVTRSMKRFLIDRSRGHGVHVFRESRFDGLLNVGIAGQARRSICSAGLQSV